MPRHHISVAALERALAGLPLGAGDLVFCHSNLGYFGRLEGAAGRSELCEIFFDAIMARLGPGGTLVVPTFTYSFPRGETFDPAATASAMGLFAEWVRRHPDSRRSLDPSFSVAAIGPGAADHTADAPENSFAAGSHFERFYKAGGKILNLNFPGCTFIHYAERELGVPYRFDKTFEGTIRVDEQNRNVRNTTWVRYLSDPALAHSPYGFDALARETGRLAVRKLGRGELTLITAGDAFEMIAETLPARPWFLTDAEALGVENPVIEPE